MDKRGFFMTFFMSVAGFIFILGGIVLIYLGIKTVTNTISIKKNGIVVEATIINKMRFTNKRNYKKGNVILYQVNYMVNGESYIDSFESFSTSYREGDPIAIYYLKDNPKKIFTHIESSNIGIRVCVNLGIALFLIFLGWQCIKNYNIFHYEKVTIVK